MLLEDCLLIRLPITTGSWAEDIPPVPDGFQATLVFGALSDAIAHAEAMGELGYTVTGVGIGDTPADTVTTFADILIERRLANAHPRWRDGLVQHGAQIFDCSLGPVQRILSGAIQAHVHAWIQSPLPYKTKMPVYLRAIS